MTTALPTVLEITETDLRPVFLHEATGFTRWLFQAPNLAWLGRAIDMALVPVSTETSTGTFRLDILAQDATTDDLVVIENQFARSDHDHLGKTLSYLAATNAKTVVWLAESFADEHRAALEWLNDHTPADVSFWAVVPKLLRIGAGPPGLHFDVVVRPNRAVKAARDSGRTLDPAIAPLRERFWTVFRDLMDRDPDMAGVTARHGGRSGHLTLSPTAGSKRSARASTCWPISTSRAEPRQRACTPAPIPMNPPRTGKTASPPCAPPCRATSTPRSPAT